jgi:hypothetical protein
MRPHRWILLLVSSATLLGGTAAVAAQPPRAPMKWEAVSCRNHVYAKVKECRVDLKKQGFVIENEEKAKHWEVEHPYSTKAAAASEVRWLKNHHRKNALVEAEE